MRPPAQKRKCLNPACPEVAIAKGYCRNHYVMLRRGSDPMAAPRAKREAGTEMLNVPTRLAPGNIAQLQAEADARGVSMYALVRDILEDWVATNRPIEAPPPAASVSRNE